MSIYKVVGLFCFLPMVVAYCMMQDVVTPLYDMLTDHMLEKLSRKDYIHIPYITWSDTVGHYISKPL